jgi:VanZ family protein
MTDEWHQSFVPGRDADCMDLVAATMGAIIAMGFISFVNRKIIRFKILEKIFS